MRELINLIENNTHKPSKAFVRCVKMYVHNIYGLYGRENSHVNKTIDRVFQAEMPELDTAYTVYRGLSLVSRDDLKPECDFFNKDVVTFGNNYLSTSLDYEVGQDFATMSINAEPPRLVGILLTIQTMNGAKGIFVDDYYETGVNDPEDEIILNTHAQFRVMRKPRRAEPPDFITHKTKDEDILNRFEYWEVDLEQIA